VVRRLTRYYARVQRLATGGDAWVSSKELADSLGLTSSTVRQDLSHLDFSGISKRGYEITGLARTLAEVLGVDRTWKAVIVGAGNVGRALVLHEEFPRQGFEICAVFDVDPGKIHESIGGLAVQSMQDLPVTVQREEVRIGIIAVPAAEAQNAADRLVAAGIRGILNMTPAYIITPSDVPVVAVRIVASLQELVHGIKRDSGDS
jgi:redox-sensing transcriptional repressor